jgi:hypothetical protein
MSRFLAIFGLLTATAGAIPALAEASDSSARTPAKQVMYRGRTRAGDPISFRLAGSRITHLTAYVPTACLATDGLPLSGTDPFDPPGAFPLGRTRTTTAKRPNAIWNTSEVTKHFLVATKRGRRGTISGKLHVDYSFLQILFTYPISSRPYVCTGDTVFRLKRQS